MALKKTPKSTKSKRGGKRPGAGRPKTKIVRSLLSQTVIGELEKLGPDLIPAVRDLVRGVFIEVAGKNGPRIYQQPPSVPMIIHVLDRTLGPVPRRTEVTGGDDSDGNPIPLILHLTSESTA